MEGRYQQAHFDNPSIWSDERWKNRRADQERARLAAAWLPSEVSSILDVGCGNGVYANIHEDNRHKIGLDLSKAALAHLTVPSIQADASRLPFPSLSFDACVCMEMLEHLPQGIYPATINELMRVSGKYILITVPYNENIKHQTVICPKCHYSFHAYNHLRSYQEMDLPNIFGNQAHLRRYKAIVPARREALPGLWNLIRRYKHRGGRNFPLNTMCPHCGYTVIADKAFDSEIGHFDKQRSAMSRWWPMTDSYMWWMGLYRKAA